MSLNEIVMWAAAIASMLFFGGGSILAFAWAIRNGQFENFDRGARSIFDPDEPIGQPTDFFPDRG